MDSKFFGVDIGRAAESVLPSLVPAVLLYALNFSLEVTLPLFLVGAAVGLGVLRTTPPGQRPLQYAHAVWRRWQGTDIYVWCPRSPPADHKMSRDEWLTRPGHTTGSSKIADPEDP